MALYRASQNSLINFLDPNSDTNKNLDNAEKIENFKNERETREAADILDGHETHKLEHKFDPENLLAKSNSIASARCGEVTDMGGPSKQIKVEGQSTIWNHEKPEVVDSGEKIREEKEEMNAFRKAERKERMSALAESIQSVDIRKDNQISAATAEGGGGNYRKSSGTFSIFDSEFNLESKIPEKTAGEKSSDDARAKREAKNTDEWKQGGKVTKVSDLGNLFD